MFQNFSWSNIFSSISSNDTQNQSSFHQNQQNYTNQKSHNIEDFYEDFIILQNHNKKEGKLTKQTFSINNSQYSSRSSSSYQNLEQSQIIYLKYKNQSLKFVQIGKQTFDHIGIKLQVFSRNHLQKLIRKLDLHLQMNQLVKKKQYQSIQKQNIQGQNYVQPLVNYYIEKINTLCSSFTNVYLVFAKWEQGQGILEKLNKTIQIALNQNFRNLNGVNPKSSPILNNHDSKKPYESNASTFISSRKISLSFIQKKLSPINQINNLNQSRSLVKSQFGIQTKIKTQKTENFSKLSDQTQNILKEVIINELLKIIESSIQGLKQELSINIKRSDLKLCDIRFQQNYKLLNCMMPEDVKLSFNEENSSFNYVLQDSFSDLTSQERTIKSLTYSSPEQLSKIIKANQSEDYVEEEFAKNQQKKLLFSSLLFKLGMITLQLWLFYQSKIQKLSKENKSKNNAKSQNLKWQSIKNKVYVEEPFHRTQIDQKTSKQSQNSYKIDWLKLSHILNSFQTEILPTKQQKLFLVVLRSLLNRSSTERNRTLQILTNHISKLSGQQTLTQKINNQMHYLSSIQPVSSNQFYLSKIQSVPLFNQLPSNINPHLNTSINYLKRNEVNIMVENRNNLIMQGNERNSLIKNEYNFNSIRNIPKNNENNFISTYNQKVIQPVQFIKFESGTVRPILLHGKKMMQNKGAEKSYKNFQNHNQQIFAQNKLDFTKKQLNYVSNSLTIGTVPSFAPAQMFQSIQKNSETPYFKLDSQNTECFKFNSVSQSTKKSLFTPSSNLPNVEQILTKQNDKNQIKENLDSSYSLSELPELQEQSPINKMPSTLSKPESQQNQLPSHIPQSSKQTINLNHNHFETKILIQNQGENQQQFSLKTQKQSTQQKIFQSQKNLQQTKVQSPQQQQVSNKFIGQKNTQQFRNRQEIKEKESQNHGQAEYVVQSYKGGGSYEGYLKNKKRNGYGKLYYHDGSRYEGQWLDDQMNGYGKLYYSSGLLAYQGNWLKDQFHGTGKVYNDTPTMLDDSFDYTNFNNLEQQWDYYEGELQHDLKQGHGIIMLQNGQYFEGDFHKDRINGQGKFVNLEGQTIHGIWKDNVLIQHIEI